MTTPKGIIQGTLVGTGYKPYFNPSSPVTENQKPIFYVEIRNDDGITETYHGTMLKDELERLGLLENDELKEYPYISMADYGVQKVQDNDVIVNKRIWEIEKLEPLQELSNSLERDDSREIGKTPPPLPPLQIHDEMTPDEKVKAITEFAKDKVIVKGKNLRQMRADDIIDSLSDEIKGKYQIQIKNFSLGKETLLFKPHGRDEADFELRKNGKLHTNRSDRETIKSMLDVAESQGWGAVKIKGSKEFKSQMFIEASLRGLEVKGYKPSREDLLNLQMRQDLQRSEAEKAGTKITLQSDLKTIFEEKQQQLAPQGIFSKIKGIALGKVDFEAFQDKIAELKQQYEENLKEADFTQVQQFIQESKNLPSLDEPSTTLDNTADLIARMQLESEIIETGRYQELYNEHMQKDVETGNEIEAQPRDIELEQAQSDLEQTLDELEPPVQAQEPIAEVKEPLLENEPIAVDEPQKTEEPTVQVEEHEQNSPILEAEPVVETQISEEVQDNKEPPLMEQEPTEPSHEKINEPSEPNYGQYSDNQPVFEPVYEQIQEPSEPIYEQNHEPNIDDLPTMPDYMKDEIPLSNYDNYEPIYNKDEPSYDTFLDPSYQQGYNDNTPDFEPNTPVYEQHASPQQNSDISFNVSVNDENNKVYQSENFRQALKIFEKNLENIDPVEVQKFLQAFDDKLNEMIDSDRMMDNKGFYNHIAGQAIETLDISKTEKMALKNEISKDFDIKAKNDVER